jgi:hypothetical protein
MKEKSMDFLLSYTMVMKNSKNKKRVRHNHEQNKSKILPQRRGEVARLNPQPPTQYEIWMVGGYETLFYLVPAT